MSAVTKRSDTHREMYATLKVNAHLSSHASIFLREERPGEWQFNVAFCSKKDQFSREFGRKIARRRYFLVREAGENILAPAVSPMKYAMNLARRIAP